MGKMVSVGGMCAWRRVVTYRGMCPWEGTAVLRSSVLRGWWPRGFREAVYGGVVV